MSRDKEIKVGQLPANFLKWGRIIIFLVFVVILGILLGLRTTKAIKGPIAITSVAEPHDLYARMAGTFHAEVRDGEEVRKKQLIGYIEGNYEPDRILALRNWLDSMTLDSVTEYPGKVAESSIRFENLQAGPLLESFTAFVKVSEELEQIKTIEQEKMKSDIASLQRQIDILDQKMNVSQKSDSLLQERSEVQSEVLRRSEVLLNDSVIAQNELDREYLDQLESDYEYILNRTALPEIRNEIEAMRKQLELTRYEYELRKNDYRRSVRLRYRELHQILDDWIYEHIIRSPIAGECVLSKLKPRFEVMPQEVVATVIPSDSAALIGRLKAPPEGISKIQVGSPVRVKLDAYPYLEYGAVFGEVVNVSKVPFEGQYNVMVKFPEGLTTNYDYTLDFSQTLKGNGEVILDKSNLFEKILQVMKWQKKSY